MNNENAIGYSFLAKSLGEANTLQKALDFLAAMNKIQSLAGHASGQLDTLREAILSMNTNERDTHFQGFAKLLLEELMTKYDHLPPGEWGPAEKDELIIAQRAYDLALHIMSTVPPIDQDWPTVREWEWDIQDIPDLTAWPTTEPPPTA